MKIDTLADLQPDLKNARVHDARNLKLIAASLREVGAARSIVIDENGRVLAGNGTVSAASKAGLTRVQVVDADGDTIIAVRRSGLTADQKQRLALLDNRTAELAEWDHERLASMLSENPAAFDGMFTERELTGMLGQRPVVAGVDPGAQPQRGAELQATWATELGQLWEIPSRTVPGRAHRLLCGDSTDPTVVARLMAGQRADLFATDPPYLVDYTGTSHPLKRGATRAETDAKNKNWSASYRDVDAGALGTGLYDGFIAAAVHEAIKPTAPWYCWHAWTQAHILRDAWLRSGALWHQSVIWAKDRPVLTRNYFMQQHEPCAFGWLKGNGPPKLPPDGTFPSAVWRIPVSEVGDVASDLWDMPTVAAGSATDHPTSKPVEIFTRPMLYHTDPGAICYEPFAGSGSQHVAAEQTGRLCYGLELAPIFVAVILERLAGMGLTPRKVVT